MNWVCCLLRRIVRTVQTKSNTKWYLCTLVRSNHVITAGNININVVMIFVVIKLIFIVWSIQTFYRILFILFSGTLENLRSHLIAKYPNLVVNTFYLLIHIAIYIKTVADATEQCVINNASKFSWLYSWLQKLAVTYTNATSCMNNPSGFISYIQTFIS